MRMMQRIAILMLAVLSVGCADVVDIQPAVATQAVAADPDDPAIWVHPADPGASLILGTNKVAAPAGAIAVFDLDGKTLQTISGLDRPNNIDVEYGVPLGGEMRDIAVATERNQHALRAFRIVAAERRIEDIGTLPVSQGEQGERSEPMGIALYRRGDGAVFAIVGRKSGPRDGYLWQYRLADDGSGRLTATKVREFGGFSGSGEIEAIAVDDELGYVYYSDELDGIHRWHADPAHPDAGRELARFGQDDFEADREGIALYTLSNGDGYIVCTDQLPGATRYLIYSRENLQLVKTVRSGADSTDGIEATSASLGPRFPGGLLVVMNSGPKNFLLYRWEDVAASGVVPLEVR